MSRLLTAIRNLVLASAELRKWERLDRALTACYPDTPVKVIRVAKLNAIYDLMEVAQRIADIDRENKFGHRFFVEVEAADVNALRIGISLVKRAGEGA